MTQFSKMDWNEKISCRQRKRKPTLHNAVPLIKKNVRRSVLIHEGNTNKPSGNLMEEKSK